MDEKAQPDRRAMDLLLEWMDADLPTREWIASLNAREFRELRGLVLKAAEEMLHEFRESHDDRG